MRKVGLGLLGLLGPFDRGNNDPCLTLGEVRFTPFELTQLDHAGGSPPSAKEDQYVCFPVPQILVREGCAIGPCRRERGKRLPDRHWSGVRRQARGEYK